jgi:hypothetical protein
MALLRSLFAASENRAMRLGVRQSSGALETGGGGSLGNSFWLAANGYYWLHNRTETGSNTHAERTETTPRFILLKPLLFCAALLLATAAHGQTPFGNIQFTWHGESNFFQASFELSYSTVLSNLPFATAPGDLFYSSIAVTNPLGLSYHGDNIEYVNGSTSPWNVSVNAYDWQRSTMLSIYTGDYLGNTHSRPGIIFEDNFDGSALWGEKGYWSAVQIPEASSVSLFALGALVLLLRRRLPSPAAQFSQNGTNL